ncbi:MAG TPA: Rieske 2Fe-2S domain-containing protein [Anaerolineales bacterium]|nr:Rieske 2Fe-2S domain-containing protein [Anaerolineales bacterium]
MNKKQGPVSKLHRRDFIMVALKGTLGLSSTLGLIGLIRFLGYQSDPAPQTEFELGPASNFPPGSRTPVPEAQAVLYHMPAGFIALSLVCPHLGCVINSVEQGYACPCHGSRFDAQGQVLNGPAREPMRVLRVEQTPGGQLILYTG